MKVQKSIFGFSYNGILFRVKKVETMDGTIIEQVILRHGMLNTFFTVLERTDRYIIMRSGLVTFKIIKKGVLPC